MAGWAPKQEALARWTWQAYRRLDVWDSASQFPSRLGEIGAERERVPLLFST